jgi:hypothetical protein
MVIESLLFSNHSEYERNLIYENERLLGYRAM